MVRPSFSSRKGSSKEHIFTKVLTLKMNANFLLSWFRLVSSFCSSLSACFQSLFHFHSLPHLFLFCSFHAVPFTFYEGNLNADLMSLVTWDVFLHGLWLLVTYEVAMDVFKKMFGFMGCGALIWMSDAWIRCVFGRFQHFGLNSEADECYEIFFGLTTGGFDMRNGVFRFCRQKFISN